MDLFGNEAENSNVKKVVFNTLENSDAKLTLDSGRIIIQCKHQLSKHPDYACLMRPHESLDEKLFQYVMEFRPLNAYVLRYMLKKMDLNISPHHAKMMTNEANKMPKPYAKLADTNKHIEVKTPNIKVYREILDSLNAYPVKSGYHRIPITKSLDFETLAKGMKSSLPKIAIADNVLQLNREPFPNFDGTMEALKNIPIGELNVVKANIQSMKSKSKNPKTMEEKMIGFGIETIYDLIHWLPRRYIDKSKPQEIRDLMINEPSTIVGKVHASSFLPYNKGVTFTIRTEAGDTIPVAFWNQNWLKEKFPVGTQVLVTGKLNFFKRQKQLTGSSIEFAKDAANLPIVPVYNQSESKGITTAFLVSAMRETFSRLNGISAPKYFKLVGSKIEYGEAYNEIHLPSDLKHRNRMIDALAYYELVYMQLLIQSGNREAKEREGIVMPETENNYQNKMIQQLPYTLTGSQQKAVAALNMKLSGSTPSTTLLNAEVGAGKSIVAQSACLRAIESGHQAVLIGPTEVLARQLYDTFAKLVNKLNETMEQPINLVFFSNGLKAAEKRSALKGIEDGSVDIVVGTHSTISDKVTYHNLGFIAIDEQQKFGAEQRSKLLNSRSDGKIPDLLMQTATPIPRSTAQVFYGDVDMITLDEKPPGRLPIVTEWIREDPNDLLEQTINPLWSDIFDESNKGNQTFVITPMVKDSDSIDAASVEKTHETLKKNFPNIRVAHVHGKMKQADQNIIMQDFRNKKYDVLVASTVVEVGVDIPDATRVIILSADRLGASSLHQVRGRVGRNSKPSKCYLVSLGLNENSESRLESLVKYENGFDVAKHDLILRGEGTMFGSSQSGASEMIFGSLLKHGRLVGKAKEAANIILDSEYAGEALHDAEQKFERDGERLF